MEFQFGGLTFTSQFDSGNLANVEKISKDEEEPDASGGSVAPATSPSVPGVAEVKPIEEFNVWTKPDCCGTPYANGNRSWFYFGIRGGQAGKMIKINIMNLNRQTRLYSQGHMPMVRTVPGRLKWERIKDKPTFETVNGNFVLSFAYRFFDSRPSVTYFAFAYPWPYDVCQEKLKELDAKFVDAAKLTSKDNKCSIYYHRELLCYSLGNLRVDLLTISDCHGIQDVEEPRFDNKLFPDRASKRCKSFLGKKVYFVSSRVHPGETPSSFVFNGFLEFVLREDDPRSKQLRKQFVFKLIPLLNPDGVAQGHYRTDTRGVNLNRVYLDPCFELYPSIYAAKSLLVHHHIWNSDLTGHEKEQIAVTIKHESERAMSLKLSKKESAEFGSSAKIVPGELILSDRAANLIIRSQSPESESPLVKSMFEVEFNRSSYGSWVGSSNNSGPIAFETESVSSFSVFGNSGPDKKVRNCDLGYSDVDSNRTLVNAQNGPLRNSQNSEIATYVTRRGSRIQNSLQSSVEMNDAPSIRECEEFDNAACPGNEGSDDEGDDKTPLISEVVNTLHLCHPILLSVPPDSSGVAFYIDLHGHASKRGCFIYGNYFEDEEMQVGSMLFARLIALNSAHFDYGGCNFTEKNMYMVDKKDGSTKEGSGRVAAFKALGIGHSYTLECNYNTGRLVNAIPPASGDEGRATPPPIAGFPPKYTPAHYEDVGKAMALAALDMSETNPWSRLPCSEFSSLFILKDHLRKHLHCLRAPAKSLLNRSAKFNGKSVCQSFSNIPRVALLSRHPVNSSNQPQNSENSNINMSTNSNSSFKNISRAELKKTPLATKKTELVSSNPVVPRQRRVVNFHSITLVAPATTASDSLQVPHPPTSKRQPEKCSGISLLPLSAPVRSWNPSGASNLPKRHSSVKIDSKINSTSWSLSRGLNTQSTVNTQSQFSKNLLSSDLMLNEKMSTDSATVQKLFGHFSVAGKTPGIETEIVHCSNPSESTNNNVRVSSFLDRWSSCPIAAEQAVGSNSCEKTFGMLSQQRMTKENMEQTTGADRSKTITASADSLSSKAVSGNQDQKRRASIPAMKPSLVKNTDRKSNSVSLCLPMTSVAGSNSLLKSTFQSDSLSSKNRALRQNQTVTRISGHPVPVPLGSKPSSNEGKKIKKKKTAVKKKS